MADDRIRGNCQEQLTKRRRCAVAISPRRMNCAAPSASVAAPWMPPARDRPASNPARPPRAGCASHARTPAGSRRSWSSTSRSKPPIRIACLFYRMGDFYELFFEDAEMASRALGIVLTKRGKHLGRDIPMCGVPIHRADEYLHRLIALGHRVAVCEQTRGPGRGQEARRQERRAPRRRAPGHARHAHRGHAARRAAQQLSARHRARARAARTRRAASRSPGSTSRPASSASPSATVRGLAADIARLEPSEIIVSDALYGDAELAPYLRSLPAVTPLTRDVFDGATAERRLAGYFSVRPPPRRSARCRGSS